jgi:ABC-2 type transport system permease protein
MFGRTLGGATVSMIQALMVTIICVLAGFRPHVASLPLALVFLALIAIVFTAMGTAIASVLSDFQGFQLVMNFLVMPIFFLSGALFPLNNLPKAMDLIATIDPLSYGVDGLRATLIGVSHFGVGLDLIVLAILSFVFMAIGARLFARIQL